MGEHKTTVLQVDPIRGQILVALPDGTEVSLAPDELTTSKPEAEKVRRSRKRQRDIDPKEQAQATTDVLQAAPPITDLQAPPSRPTSTTKHRHDFTKYVLNNGSVLKVGSLCFIVSFSSPFIISRIFNSNLSDSVFVSGIY